MNELFKGSGTYSKENMLKTKEGKEILGILLHNKDIPKRLNDMGIQRVTIFDELGEDFDKDWFCSKELVLSIIPYTSIVSIEESASDPKSVIKIMADEGIGIRPQHFPAHIDENKEVTIKKIVAYFPKRNIIMALVNPFVNIETFEFFMKCLKSLKPQFLNRDQIEVEEISERMMLGIKKKRETIEHDIKSYEKEMSNYETSYKDVYQKRIRAIMEREVLSSKKFDMTDYVKNEIQIAKNMPILKSFEIKNGILELGFGDIYITGKVQTGKIKEGGVEKAKMEIKKVHIGNLNFVINPSSVSVKNLTWPKDVYPHPHANSGTCCFGESNLELTKLITNFELVKLIKLLYSWASSYNEAGGPYCKLQSFYERERDKKEIAKVRE